MTKICKYCKKEFTPMKPDHDACYDCWMEHEYVPTDRRCKNCGRPINHKPSNYRYCDECNLKLYHK